MIWRNIICTLLVFSFTIAFHSRSQTISRHLSNLNGLSNNSINCIFQDTGHNIWIGTWDGLNAFNGREFKTYRYSKNNPSSISNNVIRQIIEEDSIHLWIATDYGINRWSKNEQAFVRYFFGDDYPPHKQEKSFMLAKTIQNTIICYVKEQGFFYFDKYQDIFLPVKGLSVSEDAKSFVIDSNNRLYLLTPSGNVNQYRIAYSPDGVNLTALPAIENRNPVSEIFLSEDKLIVNYPGFVNIFDKGRAFLTSVNVRKNKDISQIIYKDRMLYISYYEGGCFSYNPDTKVLAPVLENISDKTSALSVFIDYQGILWIGTDGLGLYQIYDYNSPFKTIATTSPVRSFCENNSNDILIGTKGDGIKILRKGSVTVEDFLNTGNGLASNSVYVLKKNLAGDIFIGTEGSGISILKANSRQPERLIGSSKIEFKAVYSICFTNSDSIMWLGTSGYGLIKIELNREGGQYTIRNIKQFVSSNTQNSINNNIIYSIVPDANNEFLWIGTRGGGLNRLDIKKNEVARIENLYNLSLTNNDILSIQKDVENHIWVGTSYGLNRLTMKDNAASIVEYTDNEGIPNNTIHGILEGVDGKIWVSTNLGISSIDLENESISSYAQIDGLHNNEFADGAYFEDSGKYLYFGGVGGFSFFKPTEIYLRDFEPLLELSSLKIFNNPTNIYERIKDNTLYLTNSESQITFTFIAHDFINSENCEYSYRLINFSNEWIYNGNNPNVVFTMLPPGRYKLEVMCTNGDKVWSNNIYTINLDVAYPWWLSTYAFIIYIIVVVLIIYIAQLVIKNRIKMNRQILLDEIEKKHQQTIHESRLNFFINVAHEFFTPLTLIYSPAQYLLEKTGLDSRTKQYIQIIKNNADRMQKLINELMEFRKLETGHMPLYLENIDMKMMINYVTDNYVEIAQENKIEFKIKTENISTIISDRNSLEKILFNLISNAFKYTPASGSIHIDLRQDGDNRTLFLCIRNSGKGLTAKQMSQLFSKFQIFDNSKLRHSTSTGIGLNLTKSLVELLGGNIEVDSEPGVYVEFKLFIPCFDAETTTGNDYNPKPDSNVVHDRVGGSVTSLNILIVEDERSIRILLNDILNPYYSVSEAVDGEDALQKIGNNIPDIIICDVMMPKLDGIALISKLRANNRTKHIPIISISIKNSAEDHINAYEHGADLYIAKPFHPRHVLSAVENLISKHRLLKEYFNSSSSSLTVKDGVTLHVEDEQFLHNIISFIENNIEDENLNPSSLSDFLGVSKATLFRRLQELTNKTPSEYVRWVRLQHSSKLLITTKLTVLEIMYQSGFANKSYFYREFAKQYGMSPKDYRLKKS